MSGKSVLLIDDDRSVEAVVAEYLGDEIERLLYAARPEEGLRQALSHQPDVILLDINMPGMDGLKVCRHLKESDATRDTPIIFLTVDRDVRQIAKALDVGGDDYIMKPFNGVELRARVRVALRTKSMFDLLKRQARVDALTGLVNRAALDDALTAYVAAFERTGQPMALLMIDMDDFKKVNDIHGHGVGDDLLRSVARALRSCCRPYDVSARFGGDEFAVILVQVEGADAACAAERLMAAIQGVVVQTGSEAVRASASGGLVEADEMRPGFLVNDLVAAADAALYRAKREGRQRLVVGTTPTPIPQDG